MRVPAVLREGDPDTLSDSVTLYVAPTVATVADGNCVCDANTDVLAEPLKDDAADASGESVAKAVATVAVGDWV